MNKRLSTHKKALTKHIRLIGQKFKIKPDPQPDKVHKLPLSPRMFTNSFVNQTMIFTPINFCLQLGGVWLEGFKKEKGN